MAHTSYVSALPWQWRPRGRQLACTISANARLFIQDPQKLHPKGGERKVQFPKSVYISEEAKYPMGYSLDGAPRDGDERPARASQEILRQGQSGDF